MCICWVSKCGSVVGRAEAQGALEQREAGGCRQSSSIVSAQTEGDSGGRTPLLIILCPSLLDKSPAHLSDRSISCPGPRIMNAGE